MKQEERLLTQNWTDSKLQQYQSLMSCGYKHYDLKLIEILKAQDTKSYSQAQKDIGKWLEKFETCDMVTGELKGYWLNVTDVQSLLNGTWEVV